MNTGSFIYQNLETNPSNWEISKYKYHIKIKNGFPFKSDFFDLYEGFPLIRIRDIKSGKIKTFYKGYFSEEFIIKNDDLIIGMDGDFNLRWWEGPDALLNQRCCQILECKTFDLRFLYYLLPHQLKIINDITYFTTVKHLSIFDIYEQSVLIPPINEQKLISQYLDKKTQTIDSLIEKIVKKIQLLKEQKTALINQYVTKGLNPNVEMKNSGIEWIGEIPKHWGIKRLTILGDFSKGKNITKSDLVDIGLPVILYSHIYTKYDRSTSIVDSYISKDKSIGSTKIQSHTFLFTSSGETKEDIGKSILYRGLEDVFIGGDMVVYKFRDSDSFDPDYYSFVFNSFNCQCQKSSLSRGEIVVHIYEKQLREIRVCIPPIDEQKKIKDCLIAIEKKSMKLQENLQNKVQLLEEYRQSLIFSVVTGKIRITEDMI